MLSRLPGTTLTIHGWYYDILTGRIEEYDEQMRRFRPLAG
jgi:carbonic anhydrase